MQVLVIPLDLECEYNLVNMKDLKFCIPPYRNIESLPSGQNRRKSSLYECISC